MDCHCPLCARKAEYILKERKTGIDEYQIRCEFCRSYYIEEWQDDVLEEIGSDGRKLISEYTRRIQANNGITGLNAGNIRRIVYSQKFAEKAAAQYGLHPARVEHSGGFDGANMLFFVDADGKRFTLRVYKAAHTETEIRSQLHWMHALKTETGLSVPDPLPGPMEPSFGNWRSKAHPTPGFVCCFTGWKGIEWSTFPKNQSRPHALKIMVPWLLRCTPTQNHLSRPIGLKPSATTGTGSDRNC